MVKLTALFGSLVLVVVAFAPRPTSAVLWREQRFVEEKLIDTGSLGLPNDGLVAAFGDFNADQLLDLFYLSADQRSLSVYTWTRAAYKWEENVEARIRTTSDFIITNVVPGDYNYDGRLDLLLMGGKNPGGWWGDDETVEMAVYLQTTNGSFCTSLLSLFVTSELIAFSTALAQEVESSGPAQPMPFDATGTMRTDLLGMSSSSPSTPKLWQNVWEKSNSTSVFDM